MKFVKIALLGAAAACAFSASAYAAGGACLITKNNTNPFFVKMKEGAEAKATEMGLEFQAFAGKVDGDAQPQIEAIENCVALRAGITESFDAVIKMPFAPPATQFSIASICGCASPSTLPANAWNSRPISVALASAPSFIFTKKGLVLFLVMRHAPPAA